MSDINTTPPAENNESELIQEPVAEVTPPATRYSEPEKKPLNWPLILSLLNLLLLLGLMLYLFTGKKTEKTTVSAVTTTAAGDAPMSIAYINSDSILVNYDMVKSMRAQLESKSAKLEAELKRRQASFEKDAGYLQDQVNKKTISEASAQELYMQLQKEQQNLYEMRERYSAELAKQEFDLNVMLVDSLTNFLKRYNTNSRFDYILSYNRGSNILFANDSLDITNDVIRLLNKEYGK